VKFGPKKAASKTHHHFYLMGMLKKAATTIFLKKKLKLTNPEGLQDIQNLHNIKKMSLISGNAHNRDGNFVSE